MSLVGPRPERGCFATGFARQIPRYADRDRVRAGLTGWAQVHGLHGDTSIVARSRFDNQYIEYWSPWLDLVILARTIQAALAGTRAGRTGGPVTGAGAAMRLRETPLILMYHAVADVPQDPNQLCVPPARFAEQMSWLERSGLRGVSIGTLTRAMRAGQAGGLVGLTFDDGYTSMLDTALPELSRRGFGATAFIISGLIGRTNEWDAGPSWRLLDAAGVAELAAAGIEIGSHSATHPHLAGLPARRQATEAAASRGPAGGPAVRAGAGVRLPVRVDGRGGAPCRGRRRIRVRLRGGGAAGLPGPAGAAADVRGLAGHRGPDDRQAAPAQGLRRG